MPCAFRNFIYCVSAKFKKYFYINIISLSVSSQTLSTLRLVVYLFILIVHFFSIVINWSSAAGGSLRIDDPLHPLTFSPMHYVQTVLCYVCYMVAGRPSFKPGELNWKSLCWCANKCSCWTICFISFYYKLIEYNLLDLLSVLLFFN